jgi:hypothetical protein
VHLRPFAERAGAALALHGLATGVAQRLANPEPKRLR